MPVRSGRLPVSGLEYAELCREAESSQSLVSRVLRVTVCAAQFVVLLVAVARHKSRRHVLSAVHQHTPSYQHGNIECNSFPPKY